MTVPGVGCDWIVSEQAAFKESVRTVDSIADKKIVHKNQAARYKSRLSQAIKAMA